MATLYHYITYPEPVDALDAMFSTGVVFSTYCVVNPTNLTFYDNLGNTHIVQTAANEPWHKAQQSAIYGAMVGKSWRQTVKGSTTLATYFKLNDPDWCKDYDPLWSNQIESVRWHYKDADPNLGVATTSVMHGFDPDSPSLDVFQLTTQVNLMGWHDLTCDQVGSTATQPTIPTEAGILQVTASATVNCDMTGVETKLGEIHTDVENIALAVAFLDGIAASLGAGAAAGAVGSSLNLMVPLIQAIQGILNGYQLADIGNKIETGFNNVTNKVDQCHLDLDGIELHASYLDTMDGTFTSWYNASTLNGNLLNARMDAVENAILALADYLHYDDGSVDGNVAYWQSVLASGSGGGGGGLTEAEWRGIFHDYFAWEVGVDTWVLPELIVSLLNTGWIIYKG